MPMPARNRNGTRNESIASMSTTQLSATAIMT